jgi:hypothetical protein
MEHVQVEQELQQDADTNYALSDALREICTAVQVCHMSPLACKYATLLHTIRGTISRTALDIYDKISVCRLFCWPSSS